LPEKGAEDHAGLLLSATPPENCSCRKAKNRHAGPPALEHFSSIAALFVVASVWRHRTRAKCPCAEAVLVRTGYGEGLNWPGTRLSGPWRRLFVARSHPSRKLDLEANKNEAYALARASVNVGRPSRPSASASSGSHETIVLLGDSWPMSSQYGEISRRLRGEANGLDRGETCAETQIVTRRRSQRRQ